MTRLKYAVAMLVVWAVSATATVADRPNIILILADDLGYCDLSVQGSKQFQTPHIDSIFKSGVRFTQGYVSNSVCAPSRAGLLTGRSGSRFGFEANIPKASHKPGSTIGLDPKQKTIAAVLKTAGYKTYCIGKWHLGYNIELFHPNKRGFDHFFGLLGGSRSYWPMESGDKGKVLQENGKYLIEKRMKKFYLTDLLTDKAMEYIRKSHGKKGAPPFFMFLSYTAPHGPWHAKPEDQKRVSPKVTNQRRRIYGGMVLNMDDNVGRLLKCLDDLKLTNETMIVFLSDNGGPTGNAPTSNWPLRGSKGTLYEGGIRVPFGIQWKGTIPRGQVQSTMVSSLDLLPTFAAISGANKKTKVNTDGVSLMPLLTKKVAQFPARRLYWRRGNMTVKAVVDGQFKYHVRGQSEHLHDLSVDKTEKNDLAKSKPDLLKKMRSMYAEWEEAVPKAAFKSDWKPRKKK